MILNYIHFYEPLSGAKTFALHEALTGFTHDNEIYFSTSRMSKPTVTLAMRQALSDINYKKCKTMGIDVVRRASGGRAVLHETNDVIYCLAAPRNLFNIASSNYFIGSVVLLTLRSLGVNNSIYNKSTSILVKGKKIAGSAQSRISDGHLSGADNYYHHGFVLGYKNKDMHNKLFGHVFERDADDVSLHDFEIDGERFTDAMLKQLQEVFYAVKKEKLTVVQSSLTPYQVGVVNLLTSKYRNIFSNGSIQRGDCHTQFGVPEDKGELPEVYRRIIEESISQA